MNATPGIELLLDIHKERVARAARLPHYARPTQQAAGRSATSAAARGYSRSISPARRWAEALRGAMAPSSAPRSAACCA